MPALGWTFVAVLAMFWTGAAWITAAAAQWVAGTLASGTAAQAARDVASLPLPAWLASWVDPLWLKSLHAAWQQAVETAAAALPLAGAAAGWLVPAVWLAWSLGMALLLAGAVAVHLLARRWIRQDRSGATTARAA